MTDPTHTPRVLLAIFAGALIVVPLLLLAIQLGHSPPP